MITSFFAHMNILVTGGAGFIGSHLVDALVAQGAQVTVLDNLSTGTLANLTQSREKITFIKGDITDAQTCIDAARGQDIIFHLAAYTSAPGSMECPDRCFAINVLGTQHILHAAYVNKVQRVICTSSAAVYGNKEGICRETDMCNPQSPYGFSKLQDEYLCQQYSRCFGLETVCLRYFNVFGPRQDPHSPYAGVIAHFSEKMRNNQPIAIFGDGTQTRDFVPVATIVAANLKAAQMPAMYMTGQPFNIATGKSITLLELVEMLKKEFPHFNQPITFKADRPGDVKHSQADCSKFSQLEVYI